MRIDLAPDLVQGIAAAYSELYRAPHGERERTYRITRSLEVESRLAERFGAERVEPYRAAGAETAERLAHFLASYARHFAELGVGPEQVRGYLASERRLLGDLYHECRDPVPVAGQSSPPRAPVQLGRAAPG